VNKGKIEGPGPKRPRPCDLTTRDPGCDTRDIAGEEARWHFALGEAALAPPEFPRLPLIKHAFALFLSDPCGLIALASSCRLSPRMPAASSGCRLQRCTGALSSGRRP
jgi:hypothetical protein